MTSVSVRLNEQAEKFLNEEVQRRGSTKSAIINEMLSCDRNINRVNQDVFVATINIIDLVNRFNMSKNEKCLEFIYEECMKICGFLK